MNVTPETPLIVPVVSGPGAVRLANSLPAHLLADVARELIAVAPLSPSLVSVAMPEALLAALTPAQGSAAEASVSWETPASGRHIFGFGEADAIRGDGALDGASVALAGLRIHLADGVDHSARPRFFGGARFDPATRDRDPRWDAFGDWRFRLPVFLVACHDGQRAGSVTLRVSQSDTPEAVLRRLEDALHVARRSPGPHPPKSAAVTGEAWQAAVEKALAEIRAGDYDKIVLARAHDVQAEEAIEPEVVLGALRSHYPGCYIFSFKTGDATWLGASPELLVSLCDGVARAASLAGSRPRGETEERDRELAHELMSSTKERAEHGFVVEASRSALSALATSVEGPGKPGLMRMDNIQHLYTPIRANVAPGTGILDLVTRMHPTPAVGAWPREAAFDALPRLEQMDRGWYAAPIGWMDLDGNGEFAVALRSALVSGNSARLYAGAGIVEGSVPAEEFEETRLKLRPLAEALRES